MYDMSAHHRDEVFRRAMASSLDALITTAKIIEDRYKPPTTESRASPKLEPTRDLQGSNEYCRVNLMKN